MRNTIHRFGFFAIILCIPLFLSAEEPRTWQDDTGLFSIEATLQQIVGNSVQLRRTDDGRVITLPIARLSEADRQHIASLAAQNPFEGGAGTPTTRPLPRQPSGVNVQQPVRQPGTGQPVVQQPDSGFPSFADLEVQEVNLSRTRAVSGTAPSVWSCEPDPIPLVEVPTANRMAFRFQSLPGNMTMPRRAGFFVDPTGNKAVAAFHIPVDPSGRNPVNNFTRIFLGSTVSGEPVFHDSPLKLQPHGFSSDGTRFAFHQESWALASTGTKTLLHIAEVTPAGWTAVATFEPFAQLRRADGRANFDFDADIFSATWVDDKHLIVQSGRGTVILLNVDTGEAIWQTRLEGRGDIALSPGGKYCFFTIGNRAVLLETLTGRAIGSIDDMRNQRFRFSPNGERFATSNEQGIILGDATTGTLEAPFFVPGSARGTYLHWLDDRFLLLGNNVVDTASKTVVWTYTGLQNNVQFVGGYSWCMIDRTRQGSFLIPLTLPHATMMAREMPATGDANLVLTAGVRVALVIEDSVSEDREEIRAIMENKIDDNGWVLVNDAPITITLSMIAEEKTETTEYGVSRTIGPVPLPRPPIRSPLDGRGVEVEFQPERYHIGITEDRSELWSASRTTRPPQRIALDEIRDASLQEVVDRAMEEHSYKEWIEGVLIPRTISRPQPGRGESRVTENGIEDVARR